MLIDNLQDNDHIFTGACIRFYNTAKCFEEQCALPCGIDDSLDYIITQVYGNSEYFQLTCLTKGEVGNITSVIKREDGKNYVTGKEIKRILQSDLYKVLINKQPKIVIG